MASTFCTSCGNLRISPKGGGRWRRARSTPRGEVSEDGLSTDDDLIALAQKIHSEGTSCWDCWFFKAQGLCCPTHGTPEEKQAADREVTRRLFSSEAWLERKPR